MQAIREIVRPHKNSIRIQIPASFIGTDVEVLAFPAGKVAPHSYDVSDLAGKLSWTGDAVKEQRRLRDEW